VPDAASLPSGEYVAAQATDDELLSRLKLGKGRETALPELFTRHGEKSLRLAYRILGDWQSAEEAVQDAFLRLADKAHLWRGESGFQTFFTRVLVNVCRNRGRAMRTHKNENSRGGAPTGLWAGLAESSRVTEVAKRLEEEEVRQEIREAIQKLPENYREVLILRDLEGWSYQKIAETLEVSLDEVKIWIFRGRKKLREILERKA
jgi:RNA polymerase sigma-70 factor (ECF subfamily)